jgi:hypothetical protein
MQLYARNFESCGAFESSFNKPLRKTWTPVIRPAEHHSNPRQSASVAQQCRRYDAIIDLHGETTCGSSRTSISRSSMVCFHPVKRETSVAPARSVAFSKRGFLGPINCRLLRRRFKKFEKRCSRGCNDASLATLSDRIPNDRPSTIGGSRGERSFVWKFLENHVTPFPAAIVDSLKRNARLRCNL